jgi:hypothetical protein
MQWIFSMCACVSNVLFCFIFLPLLVHPVIFCEQGNGCETLTLGQDGAGVPSMNRAHAYVWMVKQYSDEAPRSGGMKSQYMRVAFSGVKNCSFTNDSDAPISGPEDSRWWLVAMTKFDPKEGWKFHGLNRLLPIAETGASNQPNVASILPHIK